PHGLTLLPYRTLSRSISAEASGNDPQAGQINQPLQDAKGLSGWYRVDTRGQISDGELNAPPGGELAGGAALLEDFETTMQQMAKSEEHTSELQSRENL